MNELIANEDLLVKLTNPLVLPGPKIPSDAVYTGDVGIGAPEVVVPLSAKFRVGGKFVGITSVVLVWTVAGCPFTSAAYTFVSGGGTILASSTKCRSTGQFVLREGDVGTCAGGWTLTAAPFTPVVCACKAEISVAGQVKAKAN